MSIPDQTAPENQEITSSDAHKAAQTYIWRPRDLDLGEAERIIKSAQNVSDLRGLFTTLREARDAGFIDEILPGDPRRNDMIFSDQRIRYCGEKLREENLAPDRKQKLQIEMQGISRKMLVDRNPKTGEVKYYAPSSYLPYGEAKKIQTGMSEREKAIWDREFRLGSGIIKTLNDKKTELLRMKRQERPKIEPVKTTPLAPAVPEIKPKAEEIDTEGAMLERLHAGFLEFKKLMDEEGATKDPVHAGKLRDRQAQIERQILRTLWKAGLLNKLALEGPEFSDVFIEEARDDAGKIIRIEGVVNAVKFNEDSEPIFDKDGNMVMEEMKRIEIVE